MRLFHISNLYLALLFVAVAIDPLLARCCGWRPWRRGWLVFAVVLGFAAGLLVDRIGNAQRINLLAPPVWALITWNLAVYVWLLGSALCGSASPGWLRRGVSAWPQHWRVRRLTNDSGARANAWQAFAADWAAQSLPLNGARVALALHLGAAALGLGLIAGLYLRGLVLDYRVGWESTFLDAGTVHRLLSTLFAPASALSGIALPEMQLSWHVYDAAPQSRYVLLNGARLREGDATADGVRVVAIAPTGVVLEWRGRRMFLGAGR